MAPAFSIYNVCPCVVLSPYRYPALLLYNLLILRSAAQFGGDAWRNSDEANRREMAAVVLPTGLPYMLHSITAILPLTVFSEPRFFRKPVARVRRRLFFSRPHTGSSSTSYGASSNRRLIFMYRLVMFTFRVISSVMSSPPPTPRWGPWFYPVQLSLGFPCLGRSHHVSPIVLSYSFRLPSYFRDVRSRAALLPKFP